MRARVGRSGYTFSLYVHERAFARLLEHRDLCTRILSNMFLAGCSRVTLPTRVCRVRVRESLWRLALDHVREETRCFQARLLPACSAFPPCNLVPFLAPTTQDPRDRAHSMTSVLLVLADQAADKALMPPPAPRGAGSGGKVGLVRVPIPGRYGILLSLSTRIHTYRTHPTRPQGGRSTSTSTSTG